MIKFRDLTQKVYRGKECIRFEYVIVQESTDDTELIANFKKVGKNQWVMQIVSCRTRDKDHEVYSFEYVLPRSDVPLELIAATGLRFFQLTIKEEVQKKSELDFKIGEIIRGM